MMVSVAVAAAVLGVLANLPWSSTLFGRHGWDLIAGVPPPVADGLPPGSIGSRGLGVARLARFGLGNGQFGVLAIALFVPVLVAPLVARSWRLTWAIRAAGLVVVVRLAGRPRRSRVAGFGFPSRGSCWLLLPSAWRCRRRASPRRSKTTCWPDRSAGVSRSACSPPPPWPSVCCPGSRRSARGRWHMPTLTLTSVLGQFPDNPPEGDYRILWIGDPRVMPVPAWTLAARDRIRDHRRRPVDPVRDVAGQAVEDRRRGWRHRQATRNRVDPARRSTARPLCDSLRGRPDRRRRRQHRRPAAAGAGRSRSTRSTISSTSRLR